MRPGVTDLDKARSAAQQRREALRNRDEAHKAIQRELNDLTAEALLSKVKGLTKRVDSYPQERPADADLPEDYDTARRTATEMERSVDNRQTVFLACEEAAEKAAEALRKSQVNESVLAARIKDARNSKEHAASQLAAARDADQDADLTAALASAQQQADDADTALKDAQAKHDAADPASLEALLENAREATSRAIKDLQSNSERQIGVTNQPRFPRRTRLAHPPQRRAQPPTARQAPT